MIKVTTESGSIYLIDDQKKTWARTRGAGAEVMRSDDGEFFWRSSIVIGKSMLLICPPFDKKKLDVPREITSTYVTEIDWNYND